MGHLPNFFLLQKLLFKAGLNIKETELANVLQKKNWSEDASAIDRLRIILEELSEGRFTLRHASIGSIGTSELPCLLFSSQTWTWLEIDEGIICLTDADRSERRLSQLSDIGPALVFWLQEVKPGFVVTDKSGTSALKLLLSSALRKKRWLVDISVATITVNIFAVITSLYAMQIYDRVVPTLAFQTLTTLSIGLFMIYLLDFTLKRQRSKVLDGVAADVDEEVSAFVYQRLLHAKLDALPQQVGTLTAKITGIESARQFFSSSIVFVLIDFPFAIFFLFAIFIVGGWVALIYFGFLVISLIVGFLYQSRSRKLVKTLQSRSNERLGVLVDSIRGLEVIKTSGMVVERLSFWKDLTSQISGPSLQQKKLSSNASTLASFLSQMAYAFAVIGGVFQVSEGTMTMGSMIAVSILGGRVLGPCTQVVSLMLQFENTRESLKLVDQFLQIESDRSEDRSIFPNEKPNKLVLEKVKYAHNGSKVAQLEIENLEFLAGDRVALLGQIGSGKSTLLKVVAGLYEPTEGFVKLNGIDLWSIDRNYLSNHIAYLSQNPLLMKGDLRSNLVMGRSIPDIRFKEVFDILGLDSIVRKSDQGLDYQVQEGGAGLSGGQRQLISLSRLFLGKSSIWLFDEPTASLDPKSQSCVLEAINTLIPKSDIVIVATHNPKFATEFSNRIIVLNDGLVEKDVPTSRVELKMRVS